ncbi:hypothetical protein NHE_0343 [Neorickettsia helminthoeca str. Oregon]|uniref:Uncharacterized protein n=1 Tax=Neorickettsia helminthoeca str. Oregon TaxID=1286528 RepID=X5HLK9_9RICK|nr:hypothetical protein NHE_0343 [Neorickettsia helminthoeca str. Oregon]
MFRLIKVNSTDHQSYHIFPFSTWQGMEFVIPGIERDSASLKNE